jgi:hypothetical protein
MTVRAVAPSANRPKTHRPQRRPMCAVLKASCRLLCLAITPAFASAYYFAYGRSEGESPLTSDCCGCLSGTKLDIDADRSSVQGEMGVVMTGLRTKWITALVGLSAAFLVIAGVGMIVSGGEFDETEVRVYGVVSLLGGLALIAGLWLLRLGKTASSISYSLQVVGIIVLGAAFWWLLIPTVIAVVLLYVGVFRHGLERELRPSQSS